MLPIIEIKNMILIFPNVLSSYLVNGIKTIPGLTVLGEPRLCIVSFTSEPHFHPYLIADEMVKRRWGLGRLQHPNCVHFYITPAHLKVSANQITKVN